MQKTDPIKVIYIDSSALHAELMKAGLSVYNIEVLTLAKSDESLIESLSSSKYDSADAFILEAALSDLNGLQVARRLRANGDSRPILLVSSEDRPPNGALMGIQAVFLPKPFDFDRISEAIKNVAARV